jgi:RNA polymerase sigma-70 factor (ECF subfamily)
MEVHFDIDKVLASFAKDDEQAVDLIYNHYYPRLYRFSRTFLKLDDGIDDILQEVFVRIWENRKNIRSAQTFNSYIFTITRNLLLNELRNRLNNEKFRDRLAKAAMAEEYTDSQFTDYNELKEKIDNLVEQLPERQREVFKLSRIEGLSHREIAAKLSISDKTVEYHIGQSISFLKAKLKSLGLLSMLYCYLFL